MTVAGKKPITRQEVKRLIRQRSGAGGGSGSSPTGNISGDFTVGGTTTLNGDITFSKYNGVLRAKSDGTLADDTTTTNLPEGTNLYYTDERAQDAVGSMITSDLTYVDATPSLALSTTGVTANTYGGASTIPQFTVDNKGRITAASNNTLTTGPFTGTSTTAVGTGASQNITLPDTGLAEADVLVFVNGIRYESSEYSIAGTTLTVTTNASGDSIEIIYWDGLATGGGGGAVSSVFGRTGAVVAATSDYDANQVDYSNSTSGLTATDVQAAIDEVEGRVDTLEAASSGAWDWVSNTNASGGTINVDLSGVSGGTYLLIGDGLTFDTDSVELRSRFTVSGTPVSANGSYGHTSFRHFATSTGVTGDIGTPSAATNSYMAIGTSNQGNGAGEEANFELTVRGADSSSRYTQMFGHCGSLNEFLSPSGALQAVSFQGYRLATEVNDGVRFYAESGNIDGGTVYLYKLRTSQCLTFNIIGTVND